MDILANLFNKRILMEMTVLSGECRIGETTTSASTKVKSAIGRNGILLFTKIKVYSYVLVSDHAEFSSQISA